MRKLLLLFAFAGLLSCKSDNQVQPSKELYYNVTTYIVAGDTLYSTVLTPGKGYQVAINKIGIGYFHVIRKSIGENQQLLTYSYYRDDLTPKLKREVKSYVLSDYLTGFSPVKEEAGVIYEGRLRNSTDVFSERTVGGGGLFIPLKGLPGSPGPTTTDKEVIIVAL